MSKERHDQAISIMGGHSPYHRSWHGSEEKLLEYACQAAIDPKWFLEQLWSIHLALSRARDIWVEDSKRLSNPQTSKDWLDRALSLIAHDFPLSPHNDKLASEALLKSEGLAKSKRPKNPKHLVYRWLRENLEGCIYTDRAARELSKAGTGHK